MSEETQQGQQLLSDIKRWLSGDITAQLRSYRPNLAQATGVLPGQNLPTGGNTGTGYTPAAHALDGPQHTGTISDAQHGDLAGGTLHALATAVAAGFLAALSGDAADVLRGDGSWEQLSFFDLAGTDGPVVVGSPALPLAGAGDVDAAGIVRGASFQVGANQVVGARSAGWTAATGTATRTTFDTSTATTAELAERLAALLDDLIAHGLIGS